MRNWNGTTTERYYGGVPESLVAVRDALRAALTNLVTDAPRSLECDAFHHAKADQRHGGACPVKARYEAALDAALALVAPCPYPIGGDNGSAAQCIAHGNCGCDESDGRAGDFGCGRPDCYDGALMDGAGQIIGECANCRPNALAALAQTLDLYANTRLPSNYNGKTDPVVAEVLRDAARALRALPEGQQVRS